MARLERDTARALIGLGAASMPAAALAFRCFTPMLRLETASLPARVHLETLGDPPSDMASIAITREADARLDPAVAYRITICPTVLRGLCRSRSFALPQGWTTHAAR